MNILKQWVWPVIAGFIVAGIIMLFFEWINHFIFPIPSDLDIYNSEAVRAFTASMSWKAYILVFIGWAVGAFEGGCTTAWFAKEKQFGATLALTIVLLLAGLGNTIMIGFPPIFMTISLLILATFPFLGRTALNTYQKKKEQSVLV